LDHSGRITVCARVEIGKVNRTTVNEKRRDIFLRGTSAKLFERNVARKSSRVKFGRC